MNEKENLNSNENQEILPYVDTNVEEFDDNNLNLDEINFVEDEPQVDKETIFWGCPIKKSTNLWLVLTVVLGIIFVVQFFFIFNFNFNIFFKLLYSVLSCLIFFFYSIIFLFLQHQLIQRLIIQDL